MRVLVNFLLRVRNLILTEIPATVAVLAAAVNSVTVRSVSAYAAAAGVALLRFVVSPAFQKVALREKVISPEMIAAVESVLAARKSEAVVTPAQPTTLTPANGETFTPAP